MHYKSVLQSVHTCTRCTCTRICYALLCELLIIYSIHLTPNKCRSICQIRLRMLAIDKEIKPGIRFVVIKKIKPCTTGIL